MRGGERRAQSSISTAKCRVSSVRKGHDGRTRTGMEESAPCSRFLLVVIEKMEREEELKRWLARISTKKEETLDERAEQADKSGRMIREDRERILEQIKAMQKKSDKLEARVDKTTDEMEKAQSATARLRKEGLELRERIEGVCETLTFAELDKCNRNDQGKSAEDQKRRVTQVRRDMVRMCKKKERITARRELVEERYAKIRRRRDKDLARIESLTAKVAERGEKLAWMKRMATSCHAGAEWLRLREGEMDRLNSEMESRANVLGKQRQRLQGVWENSMRCMEYEYRRKMRMKALRDKGYNLRKREDNCSSTTKQGEKPSEAEAAKGNRYYNVTT